MPDPMPASSGTLVPAHDLFLDETPALGGGGMSSTFIMMAAIFAIFYFLLIRPQQKEAKEHQSLLSSLQKGDRVATTSGIHGRVWEVRDGEVVLEIAEKVRITVDKTAVKRKMAAPAEGEGK